MKRIFEHIMNALAAVAYAEVGDFDGVLAMANQGEKAAEQVHSRDQIQALPITTK
jgi:hypothetical protein